MRIQLKWRCYSPHSFEQKVHLNHFNALAESKFINSFGWTYLFINGFIRLNFVERCLITVSVVYSTYHNYHCSFISVSFFYSLQWFNFYLLCEKKTQRTRLNVNHDLFIGCKKKRMHKHTAYTTFTCDR